MRYCITYYNKKQRLYSLNKAVVFLIKKLMAGGWLCTEPSAKVSPHISTLEWRRLRPKGRRPSIRSARAGFACRTPPFKRANMRGDCVPGRRPGTPIFNLYMNSLHYIYFDILINTNELLFQYKKHVLQTCYNLIFYNWCLRAESNHRHEDFQSSALPTELQRQIYGDPNGARTHDL